MGLEIGFYLRLARERVLEFLVKEGNEQMLEDQALIAGVWDLDIRREEGFLRAVYTHQTRKAG